MQNVPTGYPCDWCDDRVPATFALVSPSVTRWADYGCDAHAATYRDTYESAAPISPDGTVVGDTFEAKVQRFAELFETSARTQLANDHPGLNLDGDGYRVKVTHAQKYTRVDFGSSGRYMVENATGEIYGIKGYGVIHRGHHYGNLDTVEGWNWGRYYGVMATRLAVR